MNQGDWHGFGLTNFAVWQCGEGRRFALDDFEQPRIEFAAVPIKVKRQRWFGESWRCSQRRFRACRVGRTFLPQLIKPMGVYYFLILSKQNTVIEVIAREYVH